MYMQSENVFAKHPLRVVAYDPVHGRNIRTYFLLGNVPRKVVEAAKKQDAAVLGSYYGPGWKRAFATPAGKAHGGAQFVGLEELDDPDFAASAPDTEEEGVAVPPPPAPGPPVYSTHAAFSLDTIADLKAKIYAVAGVPPYRQHIMISHYRVTVDGITRAVDIRALSEKTVDTVAGLPVDKSLEEGHAGIRVEAYDGFRRVPAPGAAVYFVDMHTVLRPQAAAAAVADKYQADLLYYGCVLLYWPQLSRDAFVLAVTDPAKMAAAFPKLCPARAEVEARLRLEQAAVERLYAYRAPRATRVAVTAAAVRVAPADVNMRTDARNIFDWIGTSSEVPASRARFAIADRVTGLERVVTATHRHVSSFAPRHAAAAERLAKADVAVGEVVFLFAGGGCPNSNLRLAADGTTVSTACWREDDRVGFDAAQAALQKLGAPLVGRINGMGLAALPAGGRLGGGFSRLDTVTAATYFGGAITSAGWAAVKDAWRAHERAGVIAVRGLQQTAAFTFAFRKGITEYEHTTVGDRANQYAHLFDDKSVYAQRWDTAYGGRVVHVQRRATDIRVEIVGCRGREEFDLIQRYVFAFLGDNIVADIAPAVTDPRRLKSLQERDPNLFDLKKHDPTATVYSVLCQADRQPRILDGPKEGAVKYWNFTEQAPAYYTCPSPKYPFLSFRAGIHKLGYCLPCCKKAQPPPGSFADQTNRDCLARAAPAERPAGEVSRHVLSYGKAVPPGRLSAVPDLVRGILGVSGLELCLVGVPQTCPHVPEAGFVYALAHALADVVFDENGEAVRGQTLEEVIASLAADALAAPDAFDTLACGAAAGFGGAAKFAAGLVDTFVRRRDTFTGFSPGGVAAWKAVLADLVLVSRGIAVVHITDGGGGGGGDPVANAGAGCLSASGYAIIITNASGTYPAAALDPHLYLRAYEHRRWMLSRRVFWDSHTYDDPDIVRDGVAETMRALLGAAPPNLGAATSSPPALSIDTVLATFGQAGGVWGDSQRLPPQQLVNKHGLCYGVLVGDAYLPVPPAPPVAGAPKKGGYGGTIPAYAGLAPPKYAPRPASTSKANITALIAALEKKGVPIRPQYRLTGAVEGFIADGLYFYGKMDTLETTLPEVTMPYDPADIDKCISEGVVTHASATAVAAGDANHLYRRFVAEYAAALRADRNAAVRKRLLENIGAASDILKDYPADVATVQKIIARGGGAAAIAEMIKSTTFEFDRTTSQKIAKIAAGPNAHETLLPVLDGILRSRVRLVDGDTKASTDNIFAAGAGELQVPRAKYPDLLDILAADIGNRYRSPLLSTTAGALDEDEFIVRPGERLFLQ